MSDLSCDIAVCGKFHVGRYAGFLAEAGILRRLYYSHRLGSTFGLDSRHRRNFWLKEYVTHATLRQKIFRSQLPLHAAASYWDWRVAGDVQQGSDILHVLIQGEVRRTIRQYRRLGSLILGEAINAHPTVQRALLSNEPGDAERLRRDSGYAAKCAALESCDFILAPSTFVRNSFVTAGFDARKILTLPYAMDLDPSRGGPRKVPADNLRVLCVGHIGSRKGQKYLVKAISSLRQAGLTIRLTLCGRGDEDLLAWVAEQGFCEHVAHVPNSGMREFMRRFDLFVLPSIEDGFGIVVAEALSAGLPVLVSKNAGAADLVIEGVNGFTFEAANEQAIEKALLMSLGKEFDPAQSRRRSWSDYAHELAANYRQIRSAM